MIRVDGLGKKYIIGHQSNERYTALRDVITRSAKGFVRTAGDMLRGRPVYSGDELEEFWALRDVSFEIKHGDVVGIIGRNGAGKSTLLKILSRITEPSEGRVEVKGRVASLLEVGTGFHPELTGRENIYLNGAILGMKRNEIRRKFDEIVDFSGVEKFLDTPVKRYSSGMYVRLAFAIAAHLEPEILVVDEVLAVGDAEFQKKCLGKMHDVAGHGRTVLFVSHNMAAVRQLCPNAVLLSNGRLLAMGTTSEIVDQYASTANQMNRETRAQTGPFGMELQSLSASIEYPFSISAELRIICREILDAELRVFVRNSNGDSIGFASIGGFGANPLKLAQGSHSSIITIEVSNMAAGIYQVDLELVSKTTEKVVAEVNADPIEFNPSPLAGDLVYLRSEWNVGGFRLPIKIDFVA